MKNVGKVILFLSVMSLFIIAGCGGDASEDMFNQAKAYQEAGDFLQAANTYESIVSKFPDGPRTDEAQFMIGFLYANELQDTAKAKDAYKKFLDNYSAVADSGLLISAKWELDNLGREVGVIEELMEKTPEEK